MAERQISGGIKVQQITKLWHSLSVRNRMIVLGSAMLMFWAVLALTRMASNPSMTLLYAGLESSAAGEVVGALEQRGVIYEVRGSSIFVDTTRRDELRMTLAGEGLPSSSSKGYELLDNLSGFGTTSQMFDAAYWRAKEGELARTIVSHPAITAARVHIASTGSNPFQREVRQSASISITMGGAEVTSKHARALQYLVASAVSGLSPEDVSIIDSEGGLINGTEETKASTADDRAEVLRLRAARLLEARVGRGNAVVEVALETVTQTELTRETRFDPDGRVAISTDTEERANTSNDQSSDVTVASNLPDGDVAANGASASENTEARERINYEVSSTEREITQQPGAIKRMSVAILINGLTTLDASGTPSFALRPEEELTALRDLVVAAVGIDEARGDVVTIRTLQFEPIEPSGTLVEASLLDRLAIDVMTLVQSLVLAIVALILGLFVLRPILSRPPLMASSQIGRLAVASQPEIMPLSGVIDDGEIDESGLSDVSEKALIDRSRQPLSRIDGPPEDPVVRLRSLIGQRQEETVEILRNWLEGEEEKV
ncbi:MAG: flagellar M-ring protein FliF [Roseovarius sp. BRH_c41]|uniref:flagellar basal-body MS-ring/collar protein FliF n=1 Tax=Roseovarius sp. BRH_c41 TaxID=1629709 RepID=UPI00061F1558|nr:flagellar basal-body MS-ring/collar protein FliF [Roseovarius sp. BRH_c41]KJS40700.1 MAG: flagellar M-ring protein FliF [Roseovarius sp. BRH_c41]